MSDFEQTLGAIFNTQSYPVITVKGAEVEPPFGKGILVVHHIYVGISKHQTLRYTFLPNRNGDTLYSIEVLDQCFDVTVTEVWNTIKRNQYGKMEIYAA